MFRSLIHLLSNIRHNYKDTERKYLWCVELHVCAYVCPAHSSEPWVFQETPLNTGRVPEQMGVNEIPPTRERSHFTSC